MKVETPFDLEKFKLVEEPQIVAVAVDKSIESVMSLNEIKSPRKTT
jgi:hypothetical protein